MEKTRNSTFDILKGIAMCVVILSHTAFSTAPVFIFGSVRSALFFIISGYFVKKSDFSDFIKNGGKRLAIPYFFSCALLVLLVFVADELFSWDCLEVALRSILLGSSSLPDPFMGHSGVNVGPLWFICALFLIRFYWSFLGKIKNEVILSLIVMSLAMIAYKMHSIAVVPWSVWSSFGAFGFFYAGHLLRKYNVIENDNRKVVFPICMICLVYCVVNSCIDINRCVYNAFYVIDLLACVASFLIVYVVVERFVSTNNIFGRLLNFLGRYSIVAFCIHAIDQCLNVHWLPFKFWDFFVSDFERACAVVLRIGIVVVGTYFVTKSKFLREKIFFIK